MFAKYMSKNELAKRIDILLYIISAKDELDVSINKNDPKNGIWAKTFYLNLFKDNYNLLPIELPFFEG